MPFERGIPAATRSPGVNMSGAARLSVLGHCEHRRMINWAELLEPRLSYPRRQQFRRLSRAGTAAIGSATAALLALVVASAGAALLAGVLVIAAVVLGFS